MDAGRTSERKFPGYTTKQLKDHLEITSPGMIAEAIKAEIEARENGTNKPFHTPQVTR